MTLDLDRIEALAEVLEGAPHVVEVEIGEGGSRLLLRRGTVASGSVASPVDPRPTDSAPLPAAPPEPSDREWIRAGVVGTFHQRKGQPVEIGETVAKGAPVGRIDTMRIPNDCLSPIDGVIVSVVVSEGDAVEYGQPLFEMARARG